MMPSTQMTVNGIPHSRRPIGPKPNRLPSCVMLTNPHEVMNKAATICASSFLKGSRS